VNLLGLQAVLGPELLGLGPAGGGLLGEPGRGGLGPQPLVAAPGPLVGGLVVVGGVGAAVTATGPAEGAGTAAAGMRRRPMRPLTLASLLVPLATGVLAAALLLALLAGPLSVAALLLGLALASSVGGLFAGVGAEAALAAGVVGLGERSAAVLAVPPDDPHRVSPA
jgi:hypothetical protein